MLKQPRRRNCADRCMETHIATSATTLATTVQPWWRLSNHLVQTIVPKTRRNQRHHWTRHSASICQTTNNKQTATHHISEQRKDRLSSQSDMFWTWTRTGPLSPEREDHTLHCVQHWAVRNLSVHWSSYRVKHLTSFSSLLRAAHVPSPNLKAAEELCVFKQESDQIWPGGRFSEQL